MIINSSKNKDRYTEKSRTAILAFDIIYRDKHSTLLDRKLGIVNDCFTCYYRLSIIVQEWRTSRTDTEQE